MRFMAAAKSHVKIFSFSVNKKNAAVACLKKGIKQRCLDPTLKIMFLPWSLTSNHQRESIKQTVNCSAKKSYCSVSVIVLLQQVHKGPTLWWLTLNNPRHDSSQGRWMKGAEVRSVFQTFVVLLPRDECQGAREGLDFAKETDPTRALGQGYKFHL